MLHISFRIVHCICAYFLSICLYSKRRLQPRENNSSSASNQNYTSYFSRRIIVSIGYERRQICQFEEIISHPENSERSNKFLAYYLISTGIHRIRRARISELQMNDDSGAQTLHFLDVARIPAFTLLR